VLHWSRRSSDLCGLCCGVALRAVGVAPQENIALRAVGVAPQENIALCAVGVAYQDEVVLWL